jgi:hypothetical protein
MNPILRSVLVVILGTVVAALLGAGVEALGHLVYPPPPGLDPSDPDSIRAVMANIPLGALLFVLLAWGIGTFVGAWLAARLAGRAPVVHGLLIGGLLLAAGVATMLWIPHPAWFWVAGVAVFPVAAFLGVVVASRRSDPAVRSASGG